MHIRPPRNAPPSTSSTQKHQAVDLAAPIHPVSLKAMKLATSVLLGLALTTAPALRAQAFGRFAAYEHCRFPDGLTLVEDQPLAKGIEGRTVKTIMGTRNIPLTGGTRLIYAYPDTQPFANVKVEQIPTADYKQAKLDLIANFEQILTGNDPVTRNYTLKPRLNGAEIYGLDRTRLEGAVIGIYLFFVDRTHTVTTIDFLNQDPTLRKFSSLEDYAPLRDSFISTYTRCATGGTSAAVTTAGKLPPTTPTGEKSEPVITAPLAAVTPASSTATPDSAALPDAPLPNGAAAAEAAPIAPAVAEPVTKSVPSKKAASAKALAKPPAKPAHATDAKKAPVKTGTTHPAKKASPAKEKARSDKAKTEKTKPAAPKKKKPEGDS